MHKLDVASICSFVIGVAGLVGSTPLFSDSLTTICGPYTKVVLAALAVAGLIAAQILRIIGSPSSTSTSVATVTVQAVPPSESKGPSA